MKLDPTRNQEFELVTYISYGEYESDRAVFKNTTLDDLLNKALADQQQRFREMTEEAWGIIANAGSGDWERESKEWQVAAGKWRVKYLELLTELEQDGDV